MASYACYEGKRMAEIKKPAIKIMQGEQFLYILSLTVRDLMLDNFYRVEALDIRAETGNQRLLKEKRAKALCRDVIEMAKEGQEFLPTSVFFATQGEIDYDDNKKELSFRTESDAQVCPLDVVDGQHRLEGLKLAVELSSKDEQRRNKFLNFPIIVTIAPGMDEVKRKLQFLTVNTKQEPVNRGLREAMIAQFTQDIERYEGTSNNFWLPSWINKKARMGKEQRTIQIAIKLNDDEDSPWYKRIQLANEEKSERYTIMQQTFTNSVKQYLLAPTHPINSPSFSETKKISILKSYWKAIEQLCVKHSDEFDHGVQSVVFKGAGLDFFHSISAYILTLLSNDQQYQPEAIKACMEAAVEYLPPECETILTPGYWEKGNDASALTKGTIAVAVSDFYQALKDAHGQDES